MIKTIKTLLTLFVVLGVLSACSSNTEQETDTTPEATPEPMETGMTEGEGETEVPVDTVFYFEFDQSILSSSARAALTVHAEMLRANPTSVRLEGHADERGSREYNMALGERRANAVRDFLVLQGVDSGLIETVSYGEERPASIGSDESSWSMNRRVELVK